MNKSMIAFCGLDCSQCEGYLATQAGDEAWKGRVAEKWAVEFNSPVIDSHYVTCDGCHALDGRLGGHCLECHTRNCCIQHGVSNCAECAEFETCAEIQGFMQMVPDARKNLLAIRQERI